MRCTDSISWLSSMFLTTDAITLHICCQEVMAGHHSLIIADVSQTLAACLQTSCRTVTAHQSVRGMALEVQGIAPVFLAPRWEHGALPQSLHCWPPMAYMAYSSPNSAQPAAPQVVLCWEAGAHAVAPMPRPGDICQRISAWNLPQHTVCLCVVLMRLRLRCRFFAGTRRRAKALEHLPGPTPKYWLPGFMGLIVSRQPHRYATMLAEKFGPIFKFRVLWYHVSLRPPSVPALEQYCMRTTGDDAYLYAHHAAL